MTEQPMNSFFARKSALIARYRDGHAEVMRALDGISEEELDTPEAPGEWSPRQVAHHLGESEMTSAVRIRLLIAEEHAQITGYDQELSSRVLHYDRPIELSLAAFAAARAVTVELLDLLTDEQWESAGTHSETGPLTAKSWLEYYADHAHEHADQIRRARQASRMSLG